MSDIDGADGEDDDEVDLDTRPTFDETLALGGWEGAGDLGQQRDWWDQVYLSATFLNDRYRLGLRRGWWEQPLATEVIATLGAIATGYDSKLLPDPPGKMAMLLQLDRIRALLKDGDHVFDPWDDRDAFDGWVERRLGQPMVRYHGPDTPRPRERELVSAQPSHRPRPGSTGGRRN